MAFKEATKAEAKLRLLVDGPAGSGKTYTALQMATIIAATVSGKVGLIDTEHGSASKYSDLFKDAEGRSFLTDSLEEFSLQTYVNTIADASIAGINPLVIDSISHAWNGKGGALEQVDNTPGASKFSSGWKVVTPLQNRLVEAILGYPGHVIATGRTKAEYVLEEDQRGRKVPRKIGTALVQRDGMEYEFDIILELELSGAIRVGKTRCPALTGQEFTRENVPRIVQTVMAWLGAGRPLSPLETALDAIRFAPNEAALVALRPTFAPLSDEDKNVLRPVFERRMAEVSPPVVRTLDVADLEGL